jgi:16S rRNA (guanine1207-N2)-methyltransferase
MEDVYFKKVVTYHFWQHRLQFNVAQDLFSSNDIDLGTQFLLRSIVEAHYAPPASLLDLGCGYGPLGLTLKALFPDCRAQLVDKDALAVAYTQRNAVLNALPHVNVHPSLGYDAVSKTDFDLIVSNIPGKAGDRAIKYLLVEGQYHLAPAGIMAVVAVAPLEDTVNQALTQSGAEVLLKRQRADHVVFHYRFASENNRRPRPTALQRGIYTRTEQTFHLGRVRAPMQTAYGLAEFDSLDYRTELLIKALYDFQGPDLIRRAALLNPGQGHCAVTLYKVMRPENVVLVDRDLLALEYTRYNLVNNKCPPENIQAKHRTGFGADEPVDLCVAVLREEEGQAALQLTVDQVLQNLTPGGLALIAGSSTAIARLGARLQAEKRAQIRGKEKLKGYSLLAFNSVAH